jgi:hypothetical protein
MNHLTSTSNLRPSERRFVAAMQRLGYGRFEEVRIERGEFVLDPWPTTIRSVKFGEATPNRPSEGSAPFELRKQFAELFEHVRRVERGLIRVLEVRGGLPFFMEIAEEIPSEGPPNT